MEWIRSAKLKKYDVIAAFSELNEIDWRKSGFAIEQGDIVYIYVGAPYSRIMYKTICTNNDVKSEDFIDDKKYWVNNDEEESVHEYVRLRLVSSCNMEALSLDTLTKKGYIKGRIQGAYKSINYPELFTYINEMISNVKKAGLNRVLKVGASEMTFHTITDAINFCFNAMVDYIYQKGTYPPKKNAWKYYMAWFPQFAYYSGGKLSARSNSLDSNWYNIINEDGTEIVEYNYGESKEKYVPEVNFYRLVFGKKKKEEYKFVGVFRMVEPYDDDIDYAYRKYEKVSDIFDTSKILDKPNFGFDTEFINKVFKITDITETEKEILAKARVGQGLFRENLINEHDCKCMLCKLRFKGLLIASHIKEWSNATNEERLDVNNGLLLCTLHDSLFDKHLISFDKAGKIIISSKLNQQDRALCNISENSKIEMTDEIENYMEFHRKIFFENNK